MGFFPLLVKYRKSVSTLRRTPRGDKVMIVITSFLNAADSVRVDPSELSLTIPRLIEGTKKAIRKNRSKIYKQNRTQLSDDGEVLVEKDGRYASPEDVYLQKESIEQFEKMIRNSKSYRESADIDIADAIISTTIWDESITDYVRKHLGEVDDKTFKRVCDRIRKQKERILKEIAPSK